MKLFKAKNVKKPVTFIYFVASPSAQISFNMHYKKMFLGPDAGFGHG
jgi:hypothetical protein